MAAKKLKRARERITRLRDSCNTYDSNSARSAFEAALRVLDEELKNGD